MTAADMNPTEKIAAALTAESACSCCYIAWDEPGILVVDFCADHDPSSIENGLLPHNTTAFREWDLLGAKA
jgi:hypothetical protein